MHWEAVYPTWGRTWGPTWGTLCPAHSGVELAARCISIEWAVDVWRGATAWESRRTGRRACVHGAGATGATTDSDPAARAPAGCGTTQAPTVGAAAAAWNRISGRLPPPTGAPLPGVTPEAVEGFAALQLGGHLAHRPGLAWRPEWHGLQPGACPRVPAMPLTAACCQVKCRAATRCCHVRQRVCPPSPGSPGCAGCAGAGGAVMCISSDHRLVCTDTSMHLVSNSGTGMVCILVLLPGGRPCNCALPVATAACEGCNW